MMAEETPPKVIDAPETAAPSSALRSDFEAGSGESPPSPVNISRYAQIENFVIDHIREGFADLSPLREDRLRGMIHDMIKDINERVLSYTGRDVDRFNG